MNHRPLRSSLIPALFAASFAAATLAQAPTTLTIGTWNLEFLGAEGDYRQKLPLRDDADYQKLGDKVRSLGVAVLAVQEICGEAPLQKVAAAAGPSWRVLLGTTGTWDDGKTSQQIGFLYDDKQVELLAAEELLSLPREQDGVPIFHRVPVTACFRVRATGFDFRAVTVHLKAGQKALDEQKRLYEATALHGWIRGLQQARGEDQDIVVLGDFNSTYGTGPQQALEQGGALQYIVPGRATPTIMHFPEPIDQVAVAPMFDELRRASFTVHGDFGGLSKDDWRKTYSDHFPVTVTLAAANDTDPDAKFRAVDPAFALPLDRRQAPPNALASPRAARGPASWPPKVGDVVRLVIEGAGSPMTGRLAAPLPAGVGGWVAIETDDGIVAFPQARVHRVTLPRP